jgi:general nucleoside transport system permease protein
MTVTIAAPVGLRLPERRVRTAAAYAVGGLLCIVAFGLQTRGGQDARFGLSPIGASVHVPDLVVPARPVAFALGAVCLVLAGWQGTRGLPTVWRRVATATVLTFTVFSLLLWGDAGQTMSLVGLLSGTVNRSLPLVLGALAGVLCERSGVINVAIEGQFLVGAFAGALLGSVAGLTVGLLGAIAAGGLLAALLAVFAIRYLVDQVVLGVVLNVFALGLTSFFYDRVLVPYQNTLNQPAVFANHSIPVLHDIPVLGPTFFEGNLIQYLTYALVIVVHVALFHTRWGLRTRAVGEHPEAADTVGIKVLATRYRNVIMGGAIAGIGGAYFTIGSVGAFGKNISSGKGFIALAALIFGRWSPLGAVGAALLFGFADALQNILSILGTSIPSSILLMAPYLATIFAVAGLVGKVRAPGADGRPYVKS